MSSYQHQAHMASLKLKDFDWREEKEIGFKDVSVFKLAANAFNHIIIVRATNARSIPHICKYDCTPKPLDCKPKTADKDGFLFGQTIKCAGFVVDPTLLPNVFNSAEKLTDARKCWSKFIRRTAGITTSSNVIPRDDEAGFFIVDTYKHSPNYGCLMLSIQNPPYMDFKLNTKESWERIDSLRLKYIHGDYDLYGLIDVNNVKKLAGQGELAEKEVQSEKILGEINTVHIFMRLETS